MKVRSVSVLLVDFSALIYMLPVRRFLHAGQDYEELEGLRQMLDEVEISRNEVAV